MIEGLSHVTFIARGLEKIEEMLTTILGARKVHNCGDLTFSRSKERFFDIGGLRIARMDGEPLAETTEYHMFELLSGTLGERLRR